MKRTCYICGSLSNLTRDHVPPKNLFIEPLPSNLITVDCCRSCNEEFTLDDEAFRVFASSVINRSEAGGWVWDNKVVGSSFNRSPKLKQSISRSLIPLFRDPITGYQYYGIRFPAQRCNRYLTRITKGLMRHFHPKLDYSKSEFKVTMIRPNQEIVDNIFPKLFYDERGNGVFRFWRTFYSPGKPESLWVYVFYNGLMFMVEVGKNFS